MNNVMEHKGYFGSIEYSEGDNVMYGKVLGITGLIMYEGTNISELKTEFEDMVDDYLEMCERRGVEPEIPCNDEINITLDQETRKQANKIVQSENITLKNLIELSLKEKLKKIS